MAPHDDDTTMVRRGKAAFSLTDMSRFVRELQDRHLPKLLSDLPGLMDLPDGKYSLVALALGKRMRTSSEEMEAIEEELQILKRVGNPQVRDRCSVLLKAEA
jgi:hypothetical protein